ncbi:MAG: 16S rRNA (uracil(1498)-N(3))-methyltransferase [Pseudomonadota bacterium]|nr:16S rRNA (uracil(1498)-N(3))-methyltransferase [Pseudomonadota bacterium]
MNSNYNRFFIPTPISEGQAIELPDYLINKLVNTLRYREGDKIRIFNGDKEFKATILELEKRRIKITVDTEFVHIEEPSLRLHLYQCILKNQNMDLVIQKVTELGATEFTPVLSKNSLIKLQLSKVEKKMEHWFEISRHAAEQCGRIKLLKLNCPVRLEHVSVPNNVTELFILNPKEGKKLSELKQTKPEIAVCCGPEKGFDKSEIEFLAKLGFKNLRLGPRILRAETAAISAISALQTVWGDI